MDEETRDPAGPVGLDGCRRNMFIAMAAAFVGAVCIRYALPFTATDTLMVHTRIVRSLLGGHNWGRQALVGSLEYPLFPTLSLLVSDVVFRPLGLDSGRVLAALAQIWSFCYLLRLVRPVRAKVTAVLLVGLLLFSPGFRWMVLAADPNWICAVPLCSVFYHLSRWHSFRELRDGVVCAINCGLLAFAGLGGMVFAAAVLWMMCREVRAVSRVNPEEQNGVKLLLWAPFAYCLVLWLLWNWLVMDHVFFCLGRVTSAFNSFTAGNAFAGFAAEAGAISPLVWAAAIALVLCVATPLWGVGACLLAALIGVAIVRNAAAAVELYPGSATLILMVSAVVALLMVWLMDAGDTDRRAWHRIRLARLTVFPALFVCLFDPGVSLVSEGAFSADAPPAADITDWVDQYWPNSRTAVYGLRVPAIYHDLSETRFVARLDYHEGVFLEQAGHEQMHLLVPPPDGRFYARGTSPFARLHRDGSRWLFLEKQWPSRWQLWRCVVPPDGESKLRDLR